MNSIDIDGSHFGSVQNTTDVFLERLGDYIRETVRPEVAEICSRACLCGNLTETSMAQPVTAYYFSFQNQEFFIMDFIDTQTSLHYTDFYEVFPKK